MIKIIHNPHKSKRIFSKISKISFFIWLISILIFFILIIPLGNTTENQLLYQKIIMFLIPNVILGILLFILGFTFYLLSLLIRDNQAIPEKNTHDFNLNKFLIGLIYLLTILVLIFYSRANNLNHENNKNLKSVSSTSTENRKQPTESPNLPTKSPTTNPSKPITVATPKSKEPWGVAKQIDEVTWTMKIGQDERIGTPQEIYEALNVYRQQHGKGILTWDQNLAAYAQQRANYFNSIKNIDKHVGFKEYTNNIENLRKLGFWSVGENCNYGQRLLGVHLIEWIYAGDKPHDDNQLNSLWTHIGVGVDGLGVDIIFGANKI